MGRKGKRSNNEGCIKQLPNGKWRCLISAGFKEDGTRNRPTKIFETEAEAVEWKNKQLAILQEFGKESIKNTNDMFVNKFRKWLVDEKLAEVYSLTFKFMMDNFNKHIKPYFADYKQKDLTIEDFQSFFKKLERNNVGAETRRKIKGILRQYFEDEYSNSPMKNPIDKVKLVTIKKIKVINPDEVLKKGDYKAVPKDLRKRFKEALDNEKQAPFLKPLCYLMLFIGNRVGEVLPYQWKDFNFKNRYFSVYKAVTKEYEFDEDGNQIGGSKSVIKAPKSDNGIRPLPLLDIICEVLSEWREYRKMQEKITGISFTAPEDFLFATNQGKMRSRDGTNAIFQRFLERNNLRGKGIHFHALRQTVSNAFFDENFEEDAAEKILGHAPGTTRKHYNSREQFDSVQKAAQLLNSKLKPKDPKYLAGPEITFAPTGYISEHESNEWEVEKPKEEQKRTIEDLISELASYPEFQEILNRTVKKQRKSEMEAE